MRGTGSVYQRGDGVWTASVSLGAVDGKRERLVLYGPSEDAVKLKLHRTQLLVGGGGIVPSREPLGSYLDAWAESRTGLAPHTAAQYRRVCRDMDARLRAVPMGKVTTAHVQRWLDKLAVTPDTDTGKVPGPRTVQVARNILRAALNDAIRSGLLERNAAALARPPKQRRPKRTVVTATDAAAILAACVGWRYHAAVAFAIGTGLRQGEMLALGWDDIADGAVTVAWSLRREAGEYVSRPPKTEASAARVPIPAFVATALEAWDTLQAADWRRQHPGVDVDELRKRGPLFTTADGYHVNGSVLTHGFQDRLKSAKLPKIAWHDLRHATADLLAEAGIPQTVARDMLRHASYATTADHYTGTSWDSLTLAAKALDKAVGG